MNQRLKAASIGLALCLVLPACDNPLEEEPKSFLTTSTFYTTANDLDLATQAIYQSLRVFTGNGNGVLAEELAGDHGRHDPGETGTGPRLADFVVWDASQTNNTNQTWTPMYQQIYRANLVIEKAPGVEMNEATKAMLVGEAKFLRAYAYLQLIKRFSAGNKPADLGVPLLVAEADYAKDLTRAAQSEIFAQIIKDLTEAEAALPSTRSGAAVGRATRGAAQMMLADVYIWRSSFMLSNEWQQASDWAKKVIDSGTFALNNSYFGVFSPANKNNREMIFRVVVSGERANSGMNNTFGPRQLGFQGSPGGGFGLLKPTRWFLASFAPGDVRGVVGPQSDTVAFRNTACYADASRGCPLLTTGVEPGFTSVPHVWKFRPSTVNNALGDVDVPLARYAETLLFYAEAQNELGSTATAVQAVNQVRARARRGASGTENRAEPADLPATLTKEQLRDAIYMERAWELAFEHADRWLDLVRRDSMDPGYWRTQLTSHDIAGQLDPLEEHRKRFPIPQSEMDLMPSVQQNPGY